MMFTGHLTCYQVWKLFEAWHFSTLFSSPQLAETLRQLGQNNEEGRTTEASIKFLQMVQLLRVVTLDQIESVWVQFASEQPYR